MYHSLLGLRATSRTFKAMSHAPVRLSWSEKVCLIVKIVFSIPGGLYSFLRLVIRYRSVRRLVIRRCLLVALAWSMRSLSLRQSRFIARQTGETIVKYCIANHIRLETVKIQDTDDFPSATLHYLDPETNDDGNVLLYFHGGGYISPISAGHIPFARRAALTANAKLIILEYTLAPECAYPGQLAQAAAALRHVLKTRHPSQVVIGGDSAGGNLTLAVLAHIQRPHPRITPIEGGLAEQKLRAALCISPRANNECSAASYDFNAPFDIVGRDTMAKFTASWKPVIEDVWATPVKGDKAFWSDTRAERILLVVGGHEVYLDDIKQLASLMGAEEKLGSKVELAICAGEIHVQCVLDTAMRITNGLMTNAVIDWLRTV